jgi:hypothetical protein
MSLTRQPTPVATATGPDSAPGSEARSLNEQIRKRAYQIYLSRVREDVPGDPVSDWVRAEQELRYRSR